MPDHQLYDRAVHAIYYIPRISSSYNRRPNPHFTAQIYFHSNPTPLPGLLKTFGAAMSICGLEWEWEQDIAMGERGSLFKLELFLAQGSSYNEVTISLLSELLI